MTQPGIEPRTSHTESGHSTTRPTGGFLEHLEPRTNHRIHRYMYTLQSMRQNQGESVDNFIAKVKNIADKCKFSGPKELEDRLLDQHIWGTNDKGSSEILDRTG